MTAQLRRMDDQFGGGVVLDLVKSQVRFVLDLLRNHHYTSMVGLRLHAAAAELFRLAGWVSFDSGQHAVAQRFWVAGLHAAHSAGDRSLGANILGFMSCQAKDLDLFGEAVHLAEAAKGGYKGASGRVAAILSLRLAEAYAQINNGGRVEAEIDGAYNAFRESDDNSPAWSYWLDEAQINEQAGYCYTRLNDWSRAQTHLAMAIRLQEESCGREGALRNALLAITYAKQGEPEQACQIADTAISTLDADVDSDRCVGHIRHVLHALSPYRTVPVVRGLQERVSNLFGAAA